MSDRLHASSSAELDAAAPSARRLHHPYAWVLQLPKKETPPLRGKVGVGRRPNETGRRTPTEM
eukprot:4826272-Amphidinium_carterae.1